MVEWAARQGTAALVSLDFTVKRTLCRSTLHQLFARLDADQLADRPLTR